MHKGVDDVGEEDFGSLVLVLLGNSFAENHLFTVHEKGHVTFVFV